MSDRQESSSSSPGLTPRKRRSVDEEAGIPEPPDIVAETDPVCFTAEVDAELLLDSHDVEDEPSRQRSPPPGYPASEASGSSAFRPPPSFSSLFPTHDLRDHDAAASVLEPGAPHKPTGVHPVAESSSASSASPAAPAYAPSDQVTSESSNSASATLRLRDETKRVLPQDTKAHHAGEPSRSAKDEDTEPPPAYSEGSSPLHSFTYLMAAAGGASSIITQVQQGGPSLNPLGGTPPILLSWEI